MSCSSTYILIERYRILIENTYSRVNAFRHSATAEDFFNIKCYLSSNLLGFFGPTEALWKSALKSPTFAYIS